MRKDENSCHETVKHVSFPSFRVLVGVCKHGNTNNEGNSIGSSGNKDIRNELLQKQDRPELESNPHNIATSLLDKISSQRWIFTNINKTKMMSMLFLHQIVMIIFVNLVDLFSS